MRSTPLAALGAAAVGLVLAATTTVPVAGAATPSYVALGDSYSSGTGTRSYLADGTDCLRSTYAYPSLIAAERGYGLNFRACSGAEIPDVVAAQLGALNTGTGYVSISVGGNDAGFADVLRSSRRRAFASTVRQGSNAGDCGMNPIRFVLRAASGVDPSIVIEPPVGRSSPAIMRSSVVLPQPLGPIRVTISPASIESSTGASASRSPNRFDAWSTRMPGAVVTARRVPVVWRHRRP